MIRFCPLASGSKGNCLFLETTHTKILIDAGISARATESRLNLLGTSLSAIDAILISHEHGDHASGLESILNRRLIPVIANCETAKILAQEMNTSCHFKIFTTSEPFTFKDLHITAFSVQHDTIDPVAFTIETEGSKIGICTDLGFPTTLVKHHLQGCSMLYIESNHDPEMVMASSRPDTYKQRVLSRSGHLSNQEAADVVKSTLHEGLQHIYLAHLSEECNAPEKALAALKGVLGNISLSVTIASQETISEVWHGTHQK